MATSKKSSDKAQSKSSNPAEVQSEGSKNPVTDAVAERGSDRPRPPGVSWKDPDASVVNPRYSPPKSDAKMQEIDPGFTYDVRTYTGGAWVKIGEVWNDSVNNREYWGMDTNWYDKIQDLWMYPIGSNAYYADYTAFKVSINGQWAKNTKFYINKTVMP